jgi:hypothetical protein
LGAWLQGLFNAAGQVLELSVLLKGVKKGKDRVEALLTNMTDLDFVGLSMDIDDSLLSLRACGCGIYPHQ